MNKAAPLTIDWKTTSMRFVNLDYGQMIPLVASGRYGLKVIDAEKILVQLVGTLNQFTSHELTGHFMGPLIAKTNSSADMTAAFTILDKITDKKRGTGAVVCMCSALGVLRENVYAIPAWFV